MRAALGGVLVFAVSGLGVGFGWAGSFTIEPGQSALVVQVFKDGVAARLAHDHVVQARAFSGSVAYDPQKPDASSIQVKVEVGSLVADEPATRRKLGLAAGDPTAKDRADIEAAMKSEGQLAAERFPSISFASTAIAKQPDGRFLVTGRLTIRGVTREVKFPAQIAGGHQEQGRGGSAHRPRGKGSLTARPRQRQDGGAGGPLARQDP